MWKKIKELREQRAQYAKAMSDMLDQAESAKRSLSADEKAKFDELRGKAQDAADQITRYEQVSELEGAGARASDAAVAAIAAGLDPATGMPEKDLRSYSLLRAIQCRLDGKPLDGVEGEASAELAKRTGRTPKGFFVPNTLIHQRDITIALSTQVVPTQKASGFIESLRNRAVVASLGATIIGGLSGDLSIPKQSANASHYWVAEGTAPTESSPQINSQVALAPKTIGTFSDLSRKLILQSSVDAEQFARNEIASRIGLGIDLASINGSGSGAEPTGILQTSGMTAISLGTDGAALAWADVVKLETEVATNNADIGSLAYLTNSKVRGALKTTKKDSGSGIFIMENGEANGYRVAVSNQVPSDLTKGSGTALSAMIFGNWADVVMGFWSGLDILVDPYTGGNAGTVRINALQDVDIKFRRNESFRKYVDIVA